MEIVDYLRKAVESGASDLFVVAGGAFISAVIDFVIMAFVIFLMVKALNKASSLAHGKEQAVEEAPATKVCPYCLSEIPAGATRCAHCTADLTAAVDGTKF